MKMTRLCICLTVIALVGQAAQATTLTFDDLAPGTVLTTQYPGVTFSNSDGPLTVDPAYPGVPFSSPNSVLPDNFTAPGNYSKAVFASPTSFVSVVMGDFDQDEDVLHLEAYDSGNVLLGSDVQTLAADVFGGLTLTVTAPGISYAKFWGVGVSNNSDYFDNLSYAGSPVVPEPLTMGSLFLSVGALGGYIRRRIRNRAIA
jgi:hypothetical protein